VSTVEPILSQQRLSARPLALCWAPIVIVVGLAAIPLIAAATDNPFLIRLFTRVVVFAIVAVALNFVLGFGGLISMVHAALFGIGAYVVAIAAFHDFNGEPLLGWAGSSDLAITAPLAVVVTALAAAGIGIVSLRTSGLYFIMITLAFNQMFFYFFSGLSHYGGNDGLQILSSLTLAGWALPTRTPFYYVCVGTLAVVLFTLTRVVRSRFGTVVAAAKQNERRLYAIGIEPVPYKLLAFVISGAICGLAGALWAASQSFVSPADMSWMRSGEFVVMAVLGGMSRVWGPVLGAIALLTLEIGLSDWTTYWQLPVGLGIIAVIMFLQNGLAGAFTFGKARHE
jgi:branched-chain amino acid transport system permease protein